jgi:glycosyltransferase involved in cell wall biosynthesis
VGDGEEYDTLLEQSVRMGYRVLPKGQSVNEEFDIAFTSWRRDVAFVMAGIDILLMTSLNEGTPVAILEAMATAKPIVSTPVGGIPELLEKANCGTVSSDIDKLVRQIELISASDAERKKEGYSGRNYVLQRLSVKRQAEELSYLLIQGLKAIEITRSQ